MKNLTLVLALLAACSPDSPSNPPTPPDEAPKMPPAVGKVIPFAAPSGWIKEEPTNNMRKAQYGVPDKQNQAKPGVFTLSTTRIWGAESFNENLARWSAQMGGAQAKVETVPGKCKVTVVDLTGDYRSDFEPDPVPKARMLLAVVETETAPWFFKVVGPVETVSGWRDEFVAMVKAAGP